MTYEWGKKQDTKLKEIHWVKSDNGKTQFITFSYSVYYFYTTEFLNK